MLMVRVEKILMTAYLLWSEYSWW